MCEFYNIYYHVLKQEAQDFINDQKIMFWLIDAQEKFRNQTFALEIRRLWSTKNKFMFSENVTLDRFLQEINMKVIDDDERSYYEQYPLIKHSFISEPLERLIMETQQHGIVDYLIRKNIREPLKARDDSDPKVLSMFMLSAGFIVWLLTVLIASIVFLGEILHSKLSKF